MPSPTSATVVSKFGAVRSTQKRTRCEHSETTWAVARESTAGSPFWVVARYDWSDPVVLRMTVEECSWGGSGAGSVRIAPANGGGSLVHAEWTYTGAHRTRDKVMLSLIPALPDEAHHRSRVGEGFGPLRAVECRLGSNRPDQPRSALMPMSGQDHSDEFMASSRRSD